MSASIAPSSFAAWIVALRPKTLLIAVVPVAVGSALAYGHAHFRLVPALACLWGAVFLQIGTNLANDVYDHQKGADREGRLGPIRATSSGLLTSRQVLAAMLLSFALAALVGLYITYLAGPIIVVIGLASIAAAWAYTGGPWPLGYHGLGDLAVLVFFGLIAVSGTVFVLGAPVDTFTVLAAIAVGALATNVLVVNNVRDVETDRRANKGTLVVRFGRSFGVAEYGALILVAELIPIAGWLARGTPSLLLPVLTAPAGVFLWRKVATERGAPLNRRLLQTVRLMVAYGTLLALGLVLGAHDNGGP